MPTIELFVKDNCGIPLERARKYVQVAINELRTLGMHTDYKESNVDTAEGKKRYEAYEITCREKNLQGLPLIVVDGKPLYVGAGIPLPDKIILNIRRRVDSKY